MMKTDERALWLSVIMQAALDLVVARSNPNAEDIQLGAENWFFAKRFKKDFLTVCDLAGRDPQATREGAKRVLQRQRERRRNTRRVNKG